MSSATKTGAKAEATRQEGSTQSIKKERRWCEQELGPSWGSDKACDASRHGGCVSYSHASCLEARGETVAGLGRG